MTETKMEKAINAILDLCSSKEPDLCCKCRLSLGGDMILSCGDNDKMIAQAEGI